MVKSSEYGQEDLQISNLTLKTLNFLTNSLQIDKKSTGPVTTHQIVTPVEHLIGRSALFELSNTPKHSTQDIDVISGF